MQRFLLVNPRSGTDSPSAEELRDAAHERGVTVHFLQEGDDLPEVARQAGADVLGMAGGDGSSCRDRKSEHHHDDEKGA